MLGAVLALTLLSACTAPIDPVVENSLTTTAIEQSTTTIQVADERTTRPPGSTDYRDYLINGLLPDSEVLLAIAPPIYGYGDFSAYEYAQVPWDLYTAAVIACMQDLGWPVEPIGDNGYSFGLVPSGQNQAASFDNARCMAGLRAPDYAAPPRGTIEDFYRFLADVQRPCLETLGYDIPEPPSIDVFIEAYPAVDWLPYRYVPSSLPEEDWEELNNTCPQDP